LYSINHLFLSQAYMAMGNFEPGSNHAKKGIALGATEHGYYTYYGYYILFWMYVESGQWDDLKEFISQSPDLSTNQKTIYLQWAEIIRAKNKRRLAELDNESSPPPIEAYFFAGDYEKAMQMILEEEDFIKALSSGRQELRKLQGFKTAAVKFGYLDYWKEFGGPDVCPQVNESNFLCP